MFALEREEEAELPQFGGRGILRPAPFAQRRVSRTFFNQKDESNMRVGEETQKGQKGQKRKTGVIMLSLALFPHIQGDFSLLKQRTKTKLHFTEKRNKQKQTPVDV